MKKSTLFVEPVSEVLLRNRQSLVNSELYLVNPAPDHLLTELQGQAGSVEVFTQDFGHHQWFRHLDIPGEFDVLPKVPGQADTIILRLAREKQRFEMLLHAVAGTMPATARLWVVGEKRAGIQSAPKMISQFFEVVNKQDSARHCALYEAGTPKSVHLPRLEQQFSNWQLEYSARPVEICSLPGVFAHGRLDKGTRLLLDASDGLGISGKVLDFACGAGVIGACLKTACADIELSCLDVYAPSLAATAETLARNRMTGNLVASNGLEALQGRFDWIVSNPPFHQGVADDLDVAAHFFRHAGTFLNEKGRILVVFNRHLPYMGWIKEHFDHVIPLTKTREFLVVQATRK